MIIIISIDDGSAASSRACGNGAQLAARAGAEFLLAR
jgi:hypothetical protein